MNLSLPRYIYHNHLVQVGGGWVAEVIVFVPIGQATTEYRKALGEFVREFTEGWVHPAAIARAIGRTFRVECEVTVEGHTYQSFGGR